MKNVNYINIALISLFLASCSKITNPVKEIGFGSRNINYQADEKVDSLIIPPDLTEPNTLQALTQVEEIVDDNLVFVLGIVLILGFWNQLLTIFFLMFYTSRYLSIF